LFASSIDHFYVLLWRKTQHEAQNSIRSPLRGRDPGALAGRLRGSRACARHPGPRRTDRSPDRSPDRRANSGPDRGANRSASGFAVGIASFRDNNAFPFSTATIRGTDSAGNAYSSADGATVQIQIKPSALQLKVTASNDSQCGNGDDATTIYAGVGQEAWFCYTVTNTSSLEIFGVNVSGVSGSIASLLPGQTAVISEMVQVGDETLALTLVPDQCVLTGTGTDTTTGESYTLRMARGNRTVS